MAVCGVITGLRRGAQRASWAAGPQGRRTLSVSDRGANDKRTVRRPWAPARARARVLLPLRGRGRSLGRGTSAACAVSANPLPRVPGERSETRDPYVDGPRLARAVAGWGSDRLRSYVRPVDAVAHDRWPRWFPRREFQTGARFLECHWVPRSVSRLRSIDHTICSSRASYRPRREMNRSHVEFVMPG